MERNGTRALFGVLLLALPAPACEPNLVVGTWSCPVAPREPNDAGVLETVTGPVAFPWSTGFEQGFCDYDVAKGWCYSETNASFEIVDSPVRGGKHAAAFTIKTDAGAGDGARCGREGTLPTDAVYGAWYFIPEIRDNVDNWNLLHFQGGTDQPLRTLWDVSLERMGDQLYLYAYTPLGNGVPRPTDAPAVPIGSWFHIEFRLRRAADTTGQVDLYQDGVRLLTATGIRTDNTTFGQWYVGNLAFSLTPSDSTVFVDDITIRPAL